VYKRYNFQIDVTNTSTIRLNTSTKKDPNSDSIDNGLATYRQSVQSIYKNTFDGIANSDDIDERLVEYVRSLTQGEVSNEQVKEGTMKFSSRKDDMRERMEQVIHDQNLSLVSDKDKREESIEKEEYEWLERKRAEKDELKIKILDKEEKKKKLDEERNRIDEKKRLQEEKKRIDEMKPETLAPDIPLILTAGNEDNKHEKQVEDERTKKLDEEAVIRKTEQPHEKQAVRTAVEDERAKILDKEEVIRKTEQPHEKQAVRTAVEDERAKILDEEEGIRKAAEKENTMDNLANEKTDKNYCEEQSEMLVVEAEKKADKKMVLNKKTDGKKSKNAKKVSHHSTFYNFLSYTSCTYVDYIITSSLTLVVLT